MKNESVFPISAGFFTHAFLFIALISAIENGLNLGKLNLWNQHKPYRSQNLCQVSQDNLETLYINTFAIIVTIWPGQASKDECN